MSASKRKRAQRKSGSKRLAKNVKRPTKQAQPDKNALWVDTEFFRNLTQRPPQMVFRPSAPPEENYYIKLAGILLGPGERRKADRNAVAFSKSSSQSKKPKTGPL